LIHNIKHIVSSITESTILKSPRASRNSTFGNSVADSKRVKEKNRHRTAGISKLMRELRARRVRSLTRVSHFPGIPGKNEKNGSFSSLGNSGTKIKAKDQKNDVYYIC